VINFSNKIFFAVGGLSHLLSKVSQPQQSSVLPQADMYRVLSPGILCPKGKPQQDVGMEPVSAFNFLLQVKSLQAGHCPKCPYCKADFSIYFHGPISGEQKLKHQAEEQQQALAAKRAQQVGLSLACV